MVEEERILGTIQGAQDHTLSKAQSSQNQIIIDWDEIMQAELEKHVEYWNAQPENQRFRVAEKCSLQTK